MLPYALLGVDAPTYLSGGHWLQINPERSTGLLSQNQLVESSKSPSWASPVISCNYMRQHSLQFWRRSINPFHSVLQSEISSFEMGAGHPLDSSFISEGTTEDTTTTSVHSCWGRKRTQRGWKSILLARISISNQTNRLGRIVATWAKCMRLSQATAKKSSSSIWRPWMESFL